LGRKSFRSVVVDELDSAIAIQRTNNALEWQNRAIGFAIFYFRLRHLGLAALFFRKGSFFVLLLAADLAG